MFAVLSLTLIALSLSVASACKGFTIECSPKSCGGDNQIVKLGNRSYELNDKCEIISRSCTHVLPYNKALVSIQAFDGKSLVHQMKINLCDKKRAPDLHTAGFACLGIPNICPFTSNSTFCYKGETMLKASPATQKIFGYLSHVQALRLHAEIEHDTGSSCFDINFRVTKTKN